MILVVAEKKQIKTEFKSSLEDFLTPTRSGIKLVTWFGFGEASSHGGPWNGRGGGTRRDGCGEEGGGEEGVGEGSDPPAGLPVLQVTQQCDREKLQIHAGHRPPQLLHGDKRSEVTTAPT